MFREQTTPIRNYTQLFSLGLLLVIFQMTSEIPFVGVIFQAHVTLEPEDGQHRTT